MQDPPFTVKIELTEGCNLACTFCGINSIRATPGGPFKFMSPGTAKRIAREVSRLGWNPRIEMAMHGEPSLNPARDEIVAILRKHLPRTQLMMTSNGAGFVRDPTAEITAVFSAGLNVLALDDYRNVRLVSKIRARYKGAIPLVDYPAQKAWSPYKRRPRSTQVVVIMADISVPQPGVHNRLDNMGGCAAPKTRDQMGKRCAKPFRDIAFRWNGNVALCCDDWQARYKIGSILDTPLDKLWNSPTFRAARRKLYYGERDFGPCDGCSDVSVRVGLLPDKMGKEIMKRPTATDRKLIQLATSGVKWTTRIKRPWEG